MDKQIMQLSKLHSHQPMNLVKNWVRQLEKTLITKTAQIVIIKDQRHNCQPTLERAAVPPSPKEPKVVTVIMASSRRILIQSLCLEPLIHRKRLAVRRKDLATMHMDLMIVLCKTISSLDKLIPRAIQIQI